MPSVAPGSVTPRARRMRSTTYGSNAVTHTAWKQRWKAMRMVGKRCGGEKWKVTVGLIKDVDGR